MKSIHLMTLVLAALGAVGCAAHMSDVRRSGSGFDSHVVDQKLPNGSTVHVERTKSTTSGMPLGGGYGYGYGLGGLGGTYVLPNLTNEIIAPNGLTAAEQISGGTVHVVGVPVPVVQQPMSVPATAGDATRDEDLAVLAEAQLRQQREIDELKGSKINK